MPIGFRINHLSIKLEIALEDVNKLYIHEEILQDHLNKLTVKIKADGFFMHPIIVDEKSRVVLDGIHRVLAIQKLGAHFIPVCLVDYFNPNIIVGSWYRIISNLSDISELSDMFEELGFTIEANSLGKAYELVERREAVTAIFSRSKCFTIYGPQKDIKEIYDAIKKIELKLRSEGYSISYYTENCAKETVHSSKLSAALMTPSVSKEEVIKTALAHQLFPPKTTRHIIPARPMFINVPLEWLYDNLSLSQANKRLLKLLSSKKIRYLPSGQVLDRLYEEELYILT